MRRINVCVLLLAAVTFASPMTSAAQTVPGFSAEMTGGFGPHTTRTEATYYSHDVATLLRFAALIRFGPPGSIRPTLIAEYSPRCAGPLAGCGNSENCTIAPNGRCYADFPVPNGATVGI